MSTSSKPILGYWDKPGKAEPIRQLLHYAGVDFEDRRYVINEQNRLQSEWFLTEKAKLAPLFDFPNLPYYMDNDVKLTQRSAILHHLARHHDLTCRTDSEWNNANVLEQQLLDIEQVGSRFVRMPTKPTDEQKQAFFKEFSGELESLERYLRGKQFAAGGIGVSWADFLLYDFVHMVQTREPGPRLIAPFDGLNQYAKRIEALPQLDKYFATKKGAN